MSREIRTILRCATLVLCVAPSLFGQVTVLKNGVDVPEDQVNLLFRTACRVMSEEFHLNGCDDSFPVTLVLGDPNEGVSGDELTQVYFIHLNRWNEALFATSASRLILQHMVSKERKAKIVAEVLRRAKSIGPVSQQALQARNAARR